MRKQILVINDDGITAKGIKSLVEAMQGLGDIHVVAPDSPQSGMGHAVTIGDILKINSCSNFFALDYPAEVSFNINIKNNYWQFIFLT